MKKCSCIFIIREMKVKMTFFLLLLLFAKLCLTLCDPTDYSPPDSSVHEISPGKNTEVGCHFLFQGIIPTQVCIGRCVLYY